MDNHYKSQILELAKKHTYKEAAEILNKSGITSSTGKPLTAAIIGGIVHRWNKKNKTKKPTKQEQIGTITRTELRQALENLILSCPKFTNSDKIRLFKAIRNL